MEKLLQEHHGILTILVVIYISLVYLQLLVTGLQCMLEQIILHTRALIQILLLGLEGVLIIVESLYTLHAMDIIPLITPLRQE